MVNRWKTRHSSHRSAFLRVFRVYLAFSTSVFSFPAGLAGHVGFSESREKLVLV